MFGSGNKILAQLSKAIGGHRDNMIFIFDEIHLACQDRETSVIADQLKTMLDPGNKDGFPYVIGITTEEEFARDIYQRHSAFARRFHRIPIASTSPEETAEIIGSSALRNGAHLVIEKEALKTLVEKTEEAFKGRAQPAASLKVLDACIQKTGEAQKSELEQKVEKIYKQLSFHSARGAVGQGAQLLPYTVQDDEQVKMLEEELAALEKKLNAQNQEFAAFFAQRSLLDKLKKRDFETVVKDRRAKTRRCSLLPG